MDRFVRSHTLEKYGPVHAVEPVRVFELGFEAIDLFAISYCSASASTSGNSGRRLRLRLPRSHSRFDHQRGHGRLHDGHHGLDEDRRHNHDGQDTRSDFRLRPPVRPQHRRLRRPGLRPRPSSRWRPPPAKPGDAKTTGLKTTATQGKTATTATSGTTGTTDPSATADPAATTGTPQPTVDAKADATATLGAAIKPDGDAASASSVRPPPATIVRPAMPRLRPHPSIPTRRLSPCRSSFRPQHPWAAPTN